MYQIGFSSSEPTSQPAGADITNNTGPIDEFSKFEKTANPSEALAQLLESDFQFESRPSYRTQAITFVFAVLAIGGVSYFAFSSVQAPTTVAVAEKELLLPDVDKTVSQDTLPNFGIDYTVTGSIEDKVKEAETGLPKITRDTVNEREHLVKAGDTLYEIAKEYGTTVQEIVTDNAIKDPSRLKLKTKLIIR